MNELTYKNAHLKMLEAIPELKEKYDEEIRWWGNEKPGQHIIFGDVFTDFMIALLKSSENEVLLKRMFAFLEKMATSSNEDVVNVATVTVCEDLAGDPTWLTKARQYMGPETRKISDRVEKWWGRE